VLMKFDLQHRFPKIYKNRFAWYKIIFGCKLM